MLIQTVILTINKLISRKKAQKMKTKDTKKKQLRKLNGVWLLILYCFIDFGIPRLKKMNYSGSVKLQLTNTIY